MNPMARENFVWQMTDTESFNRLLGTKSAAYITDAQAVRIERIRQARMLYRGQHRKYFIDEKRSGFPTLTLKVNGVEKQIYVPINLLGLITKKSADLLFGEAPRIRCENESIQTAIDELVTRSNLALVAYRAAILASYAGETFLDICRKNGLTFITEVSADELHPVGSIGPDGQYAEYVRQATQNVGTAEKPINLLLETTYKAGSIERSLWQLSDSGEKAIALALNQWPAFKTQSPPPVEQTGLDMNTVVFIANELLEGNPVSDYDELIPLQDELNSSNSQLSRVHAIHSNPKMYFPTSAADASGNVVATDEAFFGDNPDAIPRYIEMTGKPDAAAANREFIIEGLLISSETSPALLGLKKGAVAESARKLRLELINSLAKAGRKSAYWKPALVRAVTIALKMQGLAFTESIDVEMRDGLPNDPQEVAEEIATLGGANAISLRRKLEKQNLDPEAIDKEIAEIEKEMKANMPTTLMGEPTVAGGAIETVTPLSGEEGV
jgi:hypothetical protein